MSVSPLSSTGQVAIDSRKRKREEEEVSALSCVPDELLLQALSFLSSEDLARASGVCREWSKLSSGLWKDFDLKKICAVIDQDVWEKHVDMEALGLDASGAPAIDKRIAIPFLRRLSRRVEGNAGVTVLTMPKGLTFNKLITLAGAPEQGPAARFRFVWGRIRDWFGDDAVRSTYTVAMTNSILKGSRCKNFDNHRVLAQKNGGTLPGILPISTLIFLTHMSSPEGQPRTRLYGDEPWTYTRCKDQIMFHKVVVGGYTPRGLKAASAYYAANGCGAGVAREF